MSEVQRASSTVVLAADHLARAVGRSAVRITLTGVFYGVLAPVGALTRALGSDPLEGRGSDPTTYLHRVEPLDRTDALGADLPVGRALVRPLARLSRWSGVAERAERREVNVYTLF